jgi:flagellar hook assembly protein FlgD
MLLACGIVAGFSCRLPEGADSSIVSNLRFEPEAFDSFTASTSVRYTLSRPTVTTMRICSKSRETVIILFEDLSESKGSHAHTWLGDTDEGFFAPAGSYVGVLEVEGEKYESVVRIYHR